MSRETLAETLVFAIRAGLLGEGFAVELHGDHNRSMRAGPYSLVPTEELRQQMVDVAHRIFDEDSGRVENVGHEELERYYEDELLDDEAAAEDATWD